MITTTSAEPRTAFAPVLIKYIVFNYFFGRFTLSINGRLNSGKHSRDETRTIVTNFAICIDPAIIIFLRHRGGLGAGPIIVSIRASMVAMP